MKNNWLKSLLPHAIAVLALLILATLYCKPVLDGKILSQSDNVQWQAMAKESLDYKQVHGITPLWTTSMFGGMPTYQISMESPYNYGSYIPAILSLGLPKPINVLFLEPAVYYSGIKISLFSYFIMMALLIGGFVMNWRSKKKVF